MKLAIIVRKDLDMRTGKIAVQVGHASVIAYRIACCCNDANEWFDEGQKKIVLKVPDLATLNRIERFAVFDGLQVNGVYDFGLTQIAPNTLTCIAIGPDKDEKIDAVTKGLALL